MRSLISRLMLLWVGTGLMVGCSKPTAPATVQTVGSTVAVPAQPPNPAPAQGSTQAAKPKPKSGEKKSTIPANADPKTLFLVTSKGEPFDVESTAGVLASDQFEVAVAETGFNSSQFVVDLSKNSATSSAAIGTGQRKAGFSLPKGFEEVKEHGYSSEGLPLRISCVKTGSQLALVSGGHSVVGTDVGPDESKPSFGLHVDTFYMEILEVTVQDYEKFRTDQREKKKSVPPAPSNPSSPQQTPALGVPWGIAVSYARWAGMELPTEAEFEKAARGPQGMRTPWGDGKALWSNRTLTTTGGYPTDKSPFGIFDLAGNASEWCSDLYSPTAHSEAVSPVTREVPNNWGGPKKVRDMNQRVVKGNGPDWSSWHRRGKDMGKGHPDVGFRCVLRISSDAKPADAAKAPPRAIPN